jgi:hypothetical protein
MGSPLGPFFANIFMDEFENSHMETLKELGVITWNISLSNYGIPYLDKLNI